MYSTKDINCFCIDQYMYIGRLLVLIDTVSARHVCLKTPKNGWLLTYKGIHQIWSQDQPYGPATLYRKAENHQIANCKPRYSEILIIKLLNEEISDAVCVITIANLAGRTMNWAKNADKNRKGTIIPWYIAIK